MIDPVRWHFYNTEYRASISLPDTHGDVQDWPGNCAMRLVLCVSTPELAVSNDDGRIASGIPANPGTPARHRPVWILSGHRIRPVFLIDSQERRPATCAATMQPCSAPESVFLERVHVLSCCHRLFPPVEQIKITGSTGTNSLLRYGLQTRAQFQLDTHIVSPRLLEDRYGRFAHSGTTRPSSSQHSHQLRRSARHYSSYP